MWKVNRSVFLSFCSSLKFSHLFLDFPMLGNLEWRTLSPCSSLWTVYIAAGIMTRTTWLLRCEITMNTCQVFFHLLFFSAKLNVANLKWVRIMFFCKLFFPLFKFRTFDILFFLQLTHFQIIKPHQQIIVIKFLLLDAERVHYSRVSHTLVFL